MKFVLLSVIITFLVFNTVESACDSDTIIKINSLWGDNAPSEVLGSLFGSMTYLYVPDILKSDMPGFKCIKTVLEEHNPVAIDYHLYEDDVKVVKYTMTENELNITRSYATESSESDDYVFPVYLKNGVFGFWQCRNDYEPFVNIGVLNYISRKEEDEVKEAIAEAESQLQGLGIVLPPKSNEC